MGFTYSICVKSPIRHLGQAIGNIQCFWRFQARKLKFFGTRPKWVVSYIAYTKFHLPRPVFHSPGQIFTRIGEQASASFPAWFFVQTEWLVAWWHQAISSTSVGLSLVKSIVIHLKAISHFQREILQISIKKWFWNYTSTIQPGLPGACWVKTEPCPLWSKTSTTCVISKLNHFQSASNKPLKCVKCRCGLLLLVAIWQENQ